jgi:hypothetical protein
MKVNFKGKDIADCTKEELIECIEIMVRHDNIQVESIEDEQRLEIARLREIVNGVTSAIGGSK